MNLDKKGEYENVKNEYYDGLTIYGDSILVHLVNYVRLCLFYKDDTTKDQPIQYTDNPER